MKKSIPVNFTFTEKLLCPYCSGELSYRISRQRLSCSSCGMKLSPEEYEAAAAAKKARRERSSSSFSSASFSSASSSSYSAEPSSYSPKTTAGAAENSSSETPDFVPCEHCRLLLSRGVRDLLGACPVCNKKLTGAENYAGADPAANDSFAPPDLVVPFSHEKEFFIQEFRKRLKSLEFVPDSFLKASIESVRAFYVPALLYDAEVSGEITFHGEALTDLENPRHPEFRLEEFEIEAAGSQLYSGSPENLTRELSDLAFRNLEPFDSREARPWNPVYAAIPDLTIPPIASSDYFGRSRRRFREAFEYFLADGESYTSFRAAKEKVSLTPLKVSYAWLPVWVMEIREGGKRMLCYMNGQTGKMETDIPVSKVKIHCWLLSGLLLLTGLAVWLTAPYFMPVLDIIFVFTLGASCMGILMLLYLVIAPVRWLFYGRLSWRLAGSLMAGAGMAFIIAAFLGTPEYHGKTFMYMLAMLAGGGYAVRLRWLWGGIRKHTAREIRRDPCNAGKMYAVKSDLRSRHSRKVAEKIRDEFGNY